MSDDPAHKAMLYFLEVLMNSNGPLTISQLAGRFGSRNFSTEMRTAAGSNEVGLKKFLLKYPSLFTVKGNMVSLFDGKAEDDSGSEVGDGGGPASRGLPDVSTEMAAVQYFQNRLAKKEERWVLIKSLAGNLSQASFEVRSVVGPQLEFRDWILKHPHIFEVQGDLVGLRDGISAMTTSALSRKTSFNLPQDSTSSRSHQIQVPPRTPPPQRRAPPKTPPPIRRAHSFSEKRAQQIQAQQAQAQKGKDMAQSSISSRRREAPMTMTANEYKAVMFLKDIVEKKGGIKLHNITGHFSQAPEGVRNTIGWTKLELEEFLKRNAGVFVVYDEVVNLRKNAKLNVIITGSRPQGGSSRTIMGRKGSIYHVAKLWGIIDLGKHEHVFFDKSIMSKPLDDLQKVFKVGEILSFNAVLAPKTSRARWKATRVWKEFEQQPSDADSTLSTPNSHGALSPSISIEEEINKFLPTRDCDYGGESSDYASVEDCVFNFTSHSPSQVDDSSDDLKSPSPKSATVQLAVNGSSEPPLTKSLTQAAKNARSKKYVEVACQTISTGEIVATKFYQEG